MDIVTWQAVPDDEMVTSQWDGTYVVYHRRSGLTHLLNRAMFELLSRVLREPKDADTARVELSRLAAEPAGTLEHDEMMALLLRLDELGLVRRHG